LAYQGDPETGKPTDGATHEHHIWHVAKVKAIAANHDEAVTFFCGGSRNFSKFIGIIIDATAPIARVVDEILRQSQRAGKDAVLRNR
jgi:hypothetical protein